MCIYGLVVISYVYIYTVIISLILIYLLLFISAFAVCYLTLATVR